ncbi:MAG: hypothetical protein LBD68_00400 [Zoogloeaceae bacterium]|jgi:hypothetical protein|nr:hypothetical protein [Zoogloeaceae bacterium]
MEYRSKSLAACLIALAALVVRAQDDESAREASGCAGDGCLQQELYATALRDIEAARSIQENAQSLRDAADARFEAEAAACARKFLENDCRNAARERQLESLREARRLAAQGREMEYQARVREREIKRRERAAKAEKRKPDSEGSPVCSSRESCGNEAVAP